jgi:hypothetical protein
MEKEGRKKRCSLMPWSSIPLNLSAMRSAFPCSECGNIGLSHRTLHCPTLPHISGPLLVLQRPGESMLGSMPVATQNQSERLCSFFSHALSVGQSQADFWGALAGRIAKQLRRE